MEIKQALADALARETGQSASEIEKLIETPPDPAMGDYALPCFSFAKTLRKAPPLIAQELSEKIALPKGFLRVETKGGYLNFFLDPAFIARKVLEDILSNGEKYGHSDEGKGRVVTIDYSSINIAKPFHIGHLSSTVIGHALYNLFNSLGYQAVGINHLGDWGTQFGKLIVAYQKWGNHDEIEANGVRSLLDIYVKFHDEAEKDESLNDEARAWFKKIEENDTEAVALFDWFKEVTLRDVSRVYDMLGIKFDSYAGESFYNDKMDRVIDELKAKNLLTFDQGAGVVQFPEEDNMPPCLILKADGATLYATRDLAAAIYRKEHYDFDKNLYVVAYQQNLHFKQVFKVLEMMGYEWSKDCVHVAFGMVSMEDGTLSTRKGRVIFLEDVFKKTIERAKEIITEKNPTLEDKDNIAQQIGVGALVYNTLSSSRIKDIVFSWDRALAFEGETGPYCQYTYVRARSVLRRAEEQNFDFQSKQIDYSLLSDPHSQALIKLLAAYPDAIRQACEQYEPFILTRQITQICQAYNKFYFENRILDAAEEEKRARIALSKVTADVIKGGLSLLGIETPEKM